MFYSFHHSITIWYVWVLCLTNISLQFTAVSCCIQDQQARTIGTARKLGRLYILHSSDNSVKPSISCNIVSLDTTNLWHCRLGHPSFDKIFEMKTVLPNISTKKSSSHCHTCHLAKQNRLPFVSHTTFASHPFDIIHIDVWGSFHEPTVDAYKFFLTIVDDYTRLTWVYLLKQKFDVLHVFPNFYAYVSTQFNVKIKSVRSDNAPELQFTTFFLANGILKQKKKKNIVLIVPNKTQLLKENINIWWMLPDSYTSSPMSLLPIGAILFSPQPTS